MVCLHLISNHNDIKPFSNISKIHLTKCTLIAICLIIQGGSGKKGKVEDLRGFGSDVGGRNAVRVRWETSGEANVYRVGCRGKVDLQCVEEAPGGSYYREHLPVVGTINKIQLLAMNAKNVFFS